MSVRLGKGDVRLPGIFYRIMLRKRLGPPWTVHIKGVFAWPECSLGGVLLYYTSKILITRHDIPDVFSKCDFIIVDRASKQLNFEKTVYQYFARDKHNYFPILSSLLWYYTWSPRDISFSNMTVNLFLMIFRDRGFDIKWVDDTHAIGIFSSVIAGILYILIIYIDFATNT